MRPFNLSARRSIVMAVLATLVIGCGGREPTTDRRSERAQHPDVLLVSFCTMRADRLGVYDGVDLTPIIDRLAADAIVFRAHYSQASFSGGSFASILTGRYPFHHGIYDHPRRLADDEITVGEVFRDAGYATGAFVTHRYLGARWNFTQGFDVVNQVSNGSAAAGTGPSRDRREPEERVDAALRWVAGLGQQPYLLWYQTQLTHYFPEVGPPFVAEDTFTLAAAVRERLRRIPVGRLMFDIEALELTLAEREALLALHDGAVRRSDALLGRLLAGLDRLGRLSDTIVVVTADHGEALGEGGLYFNHDSNLLEPTVKIPLIVRIPGSGSSEVDAVTRSIDLLPTLAELAAIDLSPRIDGTSLVPLIDGLPLALVAFSETRPLVEIRTSYANYPLSLPGVAGKIRMIRRDRHKLVVHPGVEGYELELFDLWSDPRERVDLAAERPELARELAGELERWFVGYRNADTTPLELEGEDLESLRALGYID